MKIVYFGTPAFAAIVLEYLLQHLPSHGIEVVAAVTKPDRAILRSATPVATPVKTVALQHNIPVYQPEIVSNLEFAPTLQSYEADLFVVVAYGEIIKQHLLDMPKIGCINLHGSLLPKYRGAAPIQRCLIDGEKETGVTIIHMVRKMDAGNMIAKASLPLDEEINYGQLEEKLCNLGKELLLKTILSLKEGPIPGTAQDESQVTFAAKIELEDCRIDWNKPAHTIHNLVRGVTPHPGAWCKVSIKGQEKRLRLLKTAVNESAGPSCNPGDLIPSDQLTVCCQEGSLTLLEVQLEGKKAMNAKEFMRGLPPNSLTFLKT
jgi:methionyl-tRNA formyltransferase